MSINPISKNDHSPIWYYNPNNKKLLRVKSSKGLNRTTNYFRDKFLGSGCSGRVYSYKPEEAGKCKAIKLSYKNCSIKSEYSISFKWPKGATGLLLRPKAYLKGRTPAKY